jgi:hypothetical protein
VVFDDFEHVSALLAVAEPSNRIFHLAITSAERYRELAINDPFEPPSWPG